MPGSGWPGDPATARTPVARTAADVARLAASADDARALAARVSGCRACPRLVAWREQVAVEKRRAFADETYWGRPVPALGSDAPRGPRRRTRSGGARRATARAGCSPVTGPATGCSPRSSGRVWRTSRRRSRAADGLELRGVRITAPVHCAPPANKPTPEERDTCRPWLVRDLAAFVADGARRCRPRRLRLGGAVVGSARGAACRCPIAVPTFGHGVEVELDGRIVLGCYHVSQQNTFTGRLTEPMLDEVLGRAAVIAGLVDS